MADAKSEKAEIKRMGAKAQKNSGRGPFQKGDAILDEWLVDVKENSKSFALNKSVWAKVSSDASRHRKDPALMVVLGEGKETVRLWVIGDSMFHLLNEAYKEKNE
jgi:hypothetical protein